MLAPNDEDRRLAEVAVEDLWAQCGGQPSRYTLIQMWLAGRVGERERCAKVAEKYGKASGDPADDLWGKAIRDQILRGPE